MDTLSKPDDFFPALSPGPVLWIGEVSHPVDALDLSHASGGSSDPPSIVARLATLTMNPGIWLAAFSPFVWSLAIWQMRSPPKRRRWRYSGFFPAAIFRSTAAISRE